MYAQHYFINKKKYCDISRSLAMASPSIASPTPLAALLSMPSAKNMMNRDVGAALLFVLSKYMIQYTFSVTPFRK